MRSLCRRSASSRCASAARPKLDRQAGKSANPGDIIQGPDLSRLPGFGAEDVAENLAGRLSNAQVVAVRNHAIGLAIGVAFLLLFTGFSAVSGGLSWFVALPGVCLAVLTYRLAWTTADLVRPRVVVVEGDVHTDEDEGQCTLRVQCYKLSLRSEVYQALPNGGPYRIFFVERARFVVGAQVLPGWSAAATPANRKRFPFSIEIG